MYGQLVIRFVSSLSITGTLRILWALDYQSPVVLVCMSLVLPDASYIHNTDLALNSVLLLCSSSVTHAHISHHLFCLVLICGLVPSTLFQSRLERDPALLSGSQWSWPSLCTTTLDYGTGTRSRLCPNTRLTQDGLDHTLTQLSFWSGLLSGKMGSGCMHVKEDSWDTGVPIGYHAGLQ